MDVSRELPDQTATHKLSEQDIKRIESRVHPLGAPLPELDYTPPPRGFLAKPFTGGVTTRLGVSSEWMYKPPLYPQPFLNLYSWSFDDTLAVDGRRFSPGASLIWRDPERIRRKKKPWSVTLLAVATEHVDRTLRLCPGLMVRLYNGTLMFALPTEVDL